MYSYPKPDPSNPTAVQFDQVAENLTNYFLKFAKKVEAPNWQSTKAPAPMVEILNAHFTIDLRHARTPEALAEAFHPNLPWADRHFIEERVSGEPINPGETWKIWPFGHSAERHLKDTGGQLPQYDHSYAERYWPKYAGSTSNGKIRDPGNEVPLQKMSGYRFPIGDLDDLVDTLEQDPLTRQAYLPIWFPEDTMAAKLGKRVPCTLGYHFIRRDDRLHIVYPMRSCDFIRHWRDDVYLTARLLLWVLESLAERDPDQWAHVIPGTFTMYMTSLHMFEVDLTNLRHAREKANG